MLSAAPSTQWMAMISRVCERVSSEVLSTTWWSETRCTCSISRTSQLPTCWTNWQVSRPKRKSRDRKVAALSTLSQWQQVGEVWADSKLIDPQKPGFHHRRVRIQFPCAAPCRPGQIGTGNYQAFEPHWSPDGHRHSA